MRGGRRGIGRGRARRVLLGLGVLLGATASRAGVCPVPLFREHAPSHPPRILSDPPLTSVSASPWVDPDPAPPGAALTFYRLNVPTSAPDPAHPTILVDRVGDAARITWDPAGAEVPQACCLGDACEMLCVPECDEAAGTPVGDGTSCMDDPPPCGPASCPATGPLFGTIKDPGGGVTFGGPGYPTLLPVTLGRVDTTSAETTLLGLVLADEEDRPWNFAGATDHASGLHHQAGGRFAHATVAATLVTIDVASESLVSSVTLAPSVNLVHLEHDTETGLLHGLALTGSGLTLSGGHVYFPAPLDLVTVDPSTGAVSTIAAGLPGGIDHFAATYDTAGKRYYYHTFSGELHAVSVVHGSLDSVAVAEHVVDLQFDDATGTLFGLETCCSTTIQGSGDEGWRTFGEIDLVEIDVGTGATTVLNPVDLPTGTTNWISGFDCELGHYVYVSDDGATRVVDVATGALVASAPPPSNGGRYHSLD